MHKSLKRLTIAGAVSAAVGVAGIPATHADTIMYPYTVVSDTVTTILSVVNHGTAQAAGTPGAQDELHYAHFHKGAADLSNTGVCDEVDARRATTPDDIVTFDLGGKFGAAANGVLFSDPTDYEGKGFALLAGAAPTRGFSLISNLVINDAELYGEARIYEVASGAMWGYRGYNSTDSGVGSPVFSNSVEVQGEVLAAGEFTPVALAPLNDWVTAFLVTPIGTTGVSVGHQRTGVWSVGFQLHDTEPSTGLELVAFDRDENPLSGHVPRQVTCVGRIDLPSLILGGASTQMPDGGWAYAEVVLPILHPDDIVRVATDQATVFKLEYNSGNTFNGEPIAGVINTAVWLRDNSRWSTVVGSRQGSGGIDGF